MARRPARRKSKVNATGRNENRTERFALIPHRVLISEAYRSLDLVARSLLTEIVMIENGKNNGSLYLSVKDATDRLGLVDARPAMRGFDDLEDRGLVQMTKDAHFHVKTADTARARCWRLTWLPFDRKPPSHVWQCYIAPPKSKARKIADRGLKAMARFRKALSSERMPVVDFPAMGADLPSDRPERLGISQSQLSQNGENTPKFVAVKIPAYTAVTMG